MIERDYFCLNHTLFTYLFLCKIQCISPLNVNRFTVSLMDMSLCVRCHLQ